MNGWLAHAHPARDGFSEDEVFGLTYSIVVAYGPANDPQYVSILTGFITHASQSGLYEFSLAETMKSDVGIMFFSIERAKLI